MKDASGEARSVIELTIFNKVGGGPLTKKISLVDGAVKSDGSACSMARGTARRATVADACEFARLIEGLQTDQAIASGSLRPDLPNQVFINTKDKIAGIVDRPDIVSRSRENFLYHPGRPALVLFDLDLKGRPAHIASRMAAHGNDYWAMLCAVLPGLSGAAHVMRASTSAGLSRSDTGQEFPASWSAPLTVDRSWVGN
jgi:hypothetical protein